MTKKRDTWRGHTVYRCPQCAFSTLHEVKLTDHTAKAHPAPRRTATTAETPADQPADTPAGDTKKGDE